MKERKLISIFSLTINWNGNSPIAASCDLLIDLFKDHFDEKIDEKNTLSFELKEINIIKLFQTSYFKKLTYTQLNELFNYSLSKDQFFLMEYLTKQGCDNVIWFLSTLQHDRYSTSAHLIKPQHLLETNPQGLK